MEILLRVEVENRVLSECSWDGAYGCAALWSLPGCELSERLEEQNARPTEGLTQLGLWFCIHIPFSCRFNAISITFHVSWFFQPENCLCNVLPLLICVTELSGKTGDIKILLCFSCQVFTPQILRCGEMWQLAMLSRITHTQRTSVLRKCRS